MHMSNTPIRRKSFRGSWLAQLVDCAPLNPGLMSSSPTLRVEIP